MIGVLVYRRLLNAVAENGGYPSARPAIKRVLLRARALQFVTRITASKPSCINPLYIHGDIKSHSIFFNISACARVGNAMRLAGIPYNRCNLLSLSLSRTHQAYKKHHFLTILRINLLDLKICNLLLENGFPMEFWE